MMLPKQKLAPLSNQMDQCWRLVLVLLLLFWLSIFCSSIYRLHFQIFLWCVCNSFVRISSLLWHCQWHTVIINLDIVSFFLIKRILFDLFHWHWHYGIAHYYKDRERVEKNRLFLRSSLFLNQTAYCQRNVVGNVGRYIIQKFWTKTNLKLRCTI